MKLKRIFHPVGHGAFYTEQFYSDGNDQPFFTVVFDCGRYETAKKGWSYARYKRELENYISNDSGLMKGEPINLLFISHFHTDHILGIEYLLKNYKVERIIIPTLTVDIFLDSLYHIKEDEEGLAAIGRFIVKLDNEYKDRICFVDIQDDGNNGNGDNDIDLLNNGLDNINSINTCTKLMIHKWYYKPYYKVDTGKRNALHAEFHRKFPLIFKTNEITFRQICKAFKSEGPEAFKDIYANIFGKDKHNSYSLTLYSGMMCDKICHKQCHIPANGKITNVQLCTNNCLYMGDYEALNQKQDCLKEFYTKEWENIGIMQVPHHGSEHNSNDGLYNMRRRICIISAASDDKYGHPDQSVINAIINNHSLPVVVSELRKTKQIFDIQIP